MRLLFAALVAACWAVPATAETVISVYGGAQSAPPSRVDLDEPGGLGTFSFTADWEGRPFVMPPHYGWRVTWWRGATTGWGVDFNHTKVYASDATLAASGLSVLEFSDGLNILTVNAWRRWPEAAGALTPYVGAGVGVSIPHVEVNAGDGLTFEYQLAGPAAAVIAGVSYALNERWAVFTEYKGTYSMNRTRLVSGGALDTNIVTHSINLGVSVSF